MVTPIPGTCALGHLHLREAKFEVRKDHRSEDGAASGGCPPSNPQQPERLLLLPVAVDLEGSPVVGS